MMKILHITNSIDKSVGGPARSVPQTCIELAILGLSIELVTQETADMVHLKETSRLTVRYKSICDLFRFGSQLSNKNIDLIHLQHIWNPYIQVMAFWARKRKIPYIITPRGMLEPWIMERNPMKKKIAMFLYQRKSIQKAAYIHATAQIEAGHIKALGFTNPISIIPNGIDLTEVKEVKADYGSKKMVFLSRIHPKKGIELLLEVWGNLETKGWKLEIAGDGDPSYITSLKYKARDLKNIQFVGPQYGKAKWDFLRSADVMVLPSYSENFGIVVAEALAVGVPVITTRETPWEDLESYNCGWWIELSVVNLKQSLEQAMQATADQIKTMGSNGIDLVRDKYDIKAVARNMSKLYQKILAKKKQAILFSYLVILLT
jgi:glycosyltransferase involved in cell wall biosynthesis